VAFPDDYSRAAGLLNALTVASLVRFVTFSCGVRPTKRLKRYRDVASGIVGALYADGWRESLESLQRLVNAVRRH